MRYVSLIAGFGYQHAGGSLHGSGAKSMTYGYICNPDGAGFFDADALELLACIGG
jgi:hypothetical protein